MGNQWLLSDSTADSFDMQDTDAPFSSSDHFAPTLKMEAFYTTLRLDYGDTYFTATAFAKAPGALISTKDPAVWNADLMVQWGTLPGRIHALTHRYAPSSPALKRPT